MIKKICTNPECKYKGIQQPVENFAWRSKGKNIRQARCKSCTRLNSKKHYNNNKEYYLKKTKKYNLIQREKLQKYIFEYLLEHPCIDCGNDNVVVLEFDHVKGAKINEISKMISNVMRLNTLKEEIEKCEVRCANCHKIRHAAENQTWKYLINEK